MKKLFFILALTATTFAVKAQDEAGKKLRFSIGVDGLLPLGDWNDFYSFGIGGTAQGDYMVDPKFAITLMSGYWHLSGKTISGYGGLKVPSVGLVPVLAGVKVFFVPQFYGSAQLGLTFFTGSGGGSSFTYAPGIGYYFSPNFDAGIKYIGFSEKGGVSSSLVGLRIAYTIN